MKRVKGKREAQNFVEIQIYIYICLHIVFNLFFKSNKTNYLNKTI